VGASAPSSLIFFNLCKVDLAATAGGVLNNYFLNYFLLLNLPCSSGNSLLARLAVPDADGNSSHGFLKKNQANERE
jgi:hypothetical protein